MRAMDSWMSIARLCHFAFHFPYRPFAIKLATAASTGLADCRHGQQCCLAKAVSAQNRRYSLSCCWAFCNGARSGWGRDPSLAREDAAFSRKGSLPRDQAVTGRVSDRAAASAPAALLFCVPILPNAWAALRATHSLGSDNAAVIAGPHIPVRMVQYSTQRWDGCATGAG